jgi:hypothetical protein
MPVRMSCFVVLCSLSISVQAGNAQDQPASWHEIALTVQSGVPVHVAPEKSMPIKDTGVPVEGHVIGCTARVPPFLPWKRPAKKN